MKEFARAGTLATRESGAQALAAIERAIAAQPPNEPIALSFNEVEDITAAFADACVSRLISGYAAGFHEDHPIFAVDATDEVRDGLSTVLANRGLVLLCLSDEGPTLLGAPEYLRETMVVADELREFSVAELAERLDLSVPAANNRLKQLLRSGAVSRSRVTPKRGGNEFHYSVPRQEA